jgi:signal transduction histidine kinase
VHASAKAIVTAELHLAALYAAAYADELDEAADPADVATATGLAVEVPPPPPHAVQSIAADGRIASSPKALSRCQRFFSAMRRASRSGPPRSLWRSTGAVKNRGLASAQVMKRAVVPAAVAIAVLVCAAVVAWLALLRGVSDAMASQARLAQDALAAGVPAGEPLARSLLRPGLHLFVVDRRRGIVVDAGSAGVHTLPGAGASPHPPPTDRGAPPPGSPGGAPVLGPAPRPGALGMLALSLAHIAPITVERDERAIEISPDARELAGWLTIEALLLAASVAAVIGVAAARSAAHARAQHRALEARAAERAAAAERFQRFLVEAGHELRTPLTVLTGYVDILRGRDAAAPLDGRIVDGMHAEASRMRVLVEKMLTLARLESEASVPRLLDVASAARDAAQTVQRRYPEREVRLRAEQTASIVIDADDYAAALGNILENAVKYAPRSEVLVETAVRDGCASTAVIDRGPGIPPAQRAAIFERFYRGREDGEGLGLGLAIVKRVAERWNGSVDCESGDGRTVFRLSFPLADEEPQHAAR